MITRWNIISMDVVKKNKIGYKEHDNGILFLVVKNDRKMRIEVGYGLEGSLPDALASSIIRNVITPYFRNEQYYEGIDAGVNAIISAVKGEYVAEKKAPGQKDKSPLRSLFIEIILFIIFFLFRGGREFGGIYFLRRDGWSGRIRKWIPRRRRGRRIRRFQRGGGSFGGGGASGGW